MLKIYLFMCLHLFFVFSISFHAEKKNMSVVKEKSYVGFDINQFGLGVVNGKFETYNMNAVIEENTMISLNVTIDVSSIRTGNKTRDRHLQSKQFFYAKQYPYIKFELTEPLDFTDLVMYGDLTIRGVVVNMAIPVSLNYHMNNNKWLLHAKIVDHAVNRNQFGLMTYKRLISNVVNTNISILLE